MKIIDSNLADQIKDLYVSDYGNFYFLDRIIISEINEGVTFSWEQAEEVIAAAKLFYGNTQNVSYISNRVNKYYIKPSDWIKFFRSNDQLINYAVVTKNEHSWFNALMERLFSNVDIVRFDNLYEAIEWAKLENKKNKVQL